MEELKLVWLREIKNKLRYSSYTKKNLFRLNKKEVEKRYNNMYEYYKNNDTNFMSKDFDVRFFMTISVLNCYLGYLTTENLMKENPI